MIKHYKYLHMTVTAGQNISRDTFPAIFSTGTCVPYGVLYHHSCHMTIEIHLGSQVKVSDVTYITPRRDEKHNK
jgi:hypothetical protein